MGRSCSAAKRRKSNISQMARKESEVIEIDDYSPSPDPKSTPIRTVFCLRNRDEIEKYEEEEECFILEFDPYKAVISTKDFGDDVDLQVVGENGQVACRDFPHPRHTCANLPFEKTSHDRHCEMCCCYVCDLPAPCPKWTGTSGHCHALNNEAWNEHRRKYRDKKPKI